MSDQILQNDFIRSNLPKTLPPLDLPPVEDGGVYARFLKTREEFPDEVTVLERKKAEDYPLSCARTYYVAPNGDDSSDGSLERPFATVARAFGALEGGVGGRILLRGGTYTLSAPIALDGQLKTAPDAPLWIGAYEGETPVFTAALTFKGADFAPVSEENTEASLLRRFNTFSENNTDNIYVADLLSMGFSRDSLGEITQKGSPILYIDGVPQTLARYPNQGEPLLPIFTGEESIKKQCKVIARTSKFYTDWHDLSDGWKITLTEENAFYSHASKWENPNDLWMQGALYEEWHRTAYAVSIGEEEGALTLTGHINCPYGLKSHPHNTCYFENVPEELDADGEWYLDRENGKLYIRRDAPLSPDAALSYISTRENLFNVTGTGYIVFDGLSFWGTLGHGLFIKECHDIFVQNSCAHDILGMGFLLYDVENTAVIYCDFYHMGDAMMTVKGYDRRRDMIPDRNIVQNCRFHDPITQVGLRIAGVMCCASHNYLRDTVMSMGDVIECIIEYNELDRGSQTIFDSGPIYCGSIRARGVHIRYNYLHDINCSLYGIYLDDLACANYVYSNIVTYADEVKGNAKGMNIHGGNQIGAYNNIFVNACYMGLNNCPNYYAKEVTDADGNPVPLLCRFYQTDEAGVSTCEDVEKQFAGGGLSYRWVVYYEGTFEGREENYLDGTGFAARFPNSTLWLKEYFLHHEQRKQNPDYDCYKATQTLVPRADTRYPWGDQSLHEYLMNCPAGDLELYVRSSAYSSYCGNIFLGCGKDLSQYTAWDVLTSEVENNAHLGKCDPRFERAKAGDMAPLAKAASWADACPVFEDIPFEKIGLTK